MESREHAQSLVKYFERIASQNENREVWLKGFTTAQEWLRLIDSENVSQEELSAFIGIVHANRYRTSGWHDLSLGAYHWVTSKGLSVIPAKEFFAPDGLQSGSRLFESTSLEHAQTLCKIFEKNFDEDPSNEAWSNGLQVTQKWIELIENNNANEGDISTLIESAVTNQRKYLSKAWFDTVLTICLWCKAIGELHLAPDDFQNLVSKSNSPKVK